MNYEQLSEKCDLEKGREFSQVSQVSQLSQGQIQGLRYAAHASINTFGPHTSNTSIIIVLVVQKTGSRRGSELTRCILITVLRRIERTNTANSLRIILAAPKKPQFLRNIFYVTQGIHTPPHPSKNVTFCYAEP